MTHTLPLSLVPSFLSDSTPTSLILYSSRTLHSFSLAPPSQPLHTTTSLTNTTWDLIDLSLDLNPSRAYLLGACTDRLIRVIDSKIAKVLYTVNLGTLGKVVHVRWVGEDRMVTSSDDKCVRVWSLQ